MTKPYRRITDPHFKINIPHNTSIEVGKEYFIITFDTNQTFRGTYDYWHDMDYILEDKYTTYSHMPYRDCEFICTHYFTCNNKKYIFNVCDYYYDFKEFKCEIKRRADNARNQMEQRTLDMILKRLVNEHFEW